MVTGGSVKLADGGMVDMSTGDTFDWKQSLWFGNSKVKLVCAPKWKWSTRRKKHNITVCSFAGTQYDSTLIIKTGKEKTVFLWYSKNKKEDIRSKICLFKKEDWYYWSTKEGKSHLKGKTSCSLMILLEMEMNQMSSCTHRSCRGSSRDPFCTLLSARAGGRPRWWCRPSWRWT